MPDNNGPWKRVAPTPSAGTRFRLVLWLALLGVGGFGFWELTKLFPGRPVSNYDQAYLVRSVAVLVVVSAGLVFSRTIKFSEIARNVALWSGVIAILVLGYTYKDELEIAGARVRSEFIPSYPVATGPHMLTLTAGEGGGFYVIGQVDGAPVEFLVDTGSSDIVLSPADAARIGIDAAALNYSHEFETAHGVGKGASITVSSLSIGQMRLRDVPVSINETAMQTSLLGMAFLKRLDSFEFHGRHLSFRWGS